MSSVGQILSIEPIYALPGAEIEVRVDGFRPEPRQDYACLIDGQAARLTAASSERLLAIVPRSIREQTAAEVRLCIGDEQSNPDVVNVAGVLAEDMHIVANPAVDPDTDAIIVTRSGSRGQRLDKTLFRIESSGMIDEFHDVVPTPTALAFDRDAKMYVTNRTDGEVWQVGWLSGYTGIHATGLGIATGIAFDRDGVMYVGDRSGTIYRIKGFDSPQVFATLEPSVAAYHLAFGPDGRLYVSAPGLASHDAIYSVDRKGDVTTFFRGLGRPQGLAFDTDGNLYVAACYRGRHGVVRIKPDRSAEHFLAGNNVVGLCFNRSGDMIVATGDAAYSFPVGIEGTLL